MNHSKALSILVGIAIVQSFVIGLLFLEIEFLNRHLESFDSYEIASKGKQKEAQQITNSLNAQNQRRLEVIIRGVIREEFVRYYSKNQAMTKENRINPVFAQSKLNIEKNILNGASATDDIKIGRLSARP
ncbi:hypothetical protein FLL45_06260 [Aliikangiella marina]|uniref:Uncharacterized protein n=1 Tax=Aliikangiella marina TaxID=1712262 RepID=A0A545TBG6_9GAMM|nr:hypothetical protein [Aliikangiella marina]TQV74562.1 hypothetical protein FLL45_06260 [Aliikangiella marina]